MGSERRRNQSHLIAKNESDHWIEEIHLTPRQMDWNCVCYISAFLRTLNDG